MMSSQHDGVACHYHYHHHAQHARHDAEIALLSDRFEALRRQDETAYRSDLEGVPPFLSTDDDDYPEWREKIVEWSYQVVDHFELSREVVSVSLSYLDRYVRVSNDREGGHAITKRSFQLVAVTCLYVAAKLFGESRRPLRLPTLLQLSRGYFDANDIVKMELTLLEALKYRVNPPTAQAFVRHFSLLLGMCPQPSIRSSLSPRQMYSIEEAAFFLTELSVFEHSASSARRSSVALASILNVLDRTCGMTWQGRTNFLEAVRRVARLDPDCEEVTSCRRTLEELRSSHCGDADAADEQEEAAPMEGQREEERTASPVSVAAFGGRVGAAAPAAQQEQNYVAAYYHERDGQCGTNIYPTHYR